MKPTVPISIVIKMRKDELIIVEWCSTDNHFNLALLDHEWLLQIFVDYMHCKLCVDIYDPLVYMYWQ